MNASKPSDDMRALLNGNISSQLSENFECTMAVVPSLSLLSANRFDILAKYIFTKFKINAINCGFAEELYLEHIKAFNGFVEADESGKVGPNGFLESFLSVIESIRGSGFSEKHPIPLSSGGVPLDGAHRLGISIALGLDVSVIHTDIESPKFDYKFFYDRGLHPKFLDFMAFEYSKIKPDTRMVLLWPTAVGQQEDIERILKSYGEIIYHKEVMLTSHGKHNVTATAYHNEEWVGSRADGFPGAANKANWCFSKPGPLRIFLIESKKDLVKMKDEIRDVFSVGKHSIHINDTHEETIELAQCLLNHNSIELLNSMAYRSFSWFNRLFTHYDEWITEQKHDTENFCVDGSGSLAAYGIRDVRDLDFLFHGELIPKTGFKEIDCHNEEQAHIGLGVDDVIFNPGNHFYHRGLKFVSIKLLQTHKERRGELKDLDDVKNIKAVLGGQLVKISLNERFQKLISPQVIKAKIKMLLLKARYFLTLVKQRLK